MSALFSTASQATAGLPPAPPLPQTLPPLAGYGESNAIALPASSSLDEPVSPSLDNQMAANDVSTAPDDTEPTAPIVPVSSEPLPPLRSPQADQTVTPPTRDNDLPPGAIVGNATFYGKKGDLTAYGEHLDPDAYTGAMYKRPFGDQDDVVKVQRRDDPTVSTTVRINDTGPFKTDRKGKALRPLEQHPTNIIDLTDAAFKALGGTKEGGIVPVIVTLEKAGPKRPRGK